MFLAHRKLYVVYSPWVTRRETIYGILFKTWAEVGLEVKTYDIYRAQQMCLLSVDERVILSLLSMELLKNLLYSCVSCALEWVGFGCVRS